MWQQPPQQALSEPGDSWEAMFDSGQLDQRLQSMNMSEPPPVMSGFSVPPPPMCPSQQVQQPPPIFSRPPPPLPNQVQRGGRGILQRPQIMTRPQQAQQVSTSFHMPPPPFNPSPVPQMYNQPRSVRSTPSFQPPVLVSNESDRGSLTQYKAPEPKLTILKRPQSSPGNLVDQGKKGGGNGNSKAKTLKQREEAYAQARLRILGSATNPEDEDEVEIVASADETAPTGPPQVIKPSDSNNSTVRAPKGPDGTKGFHTKLKSTS